MPLVVNGPSGQGAPGSGQGPEVAYARQNYDTSGWTPADWAANYGNYYNNVSTVRPVEWGGYTGNEGMTNAGGGAPGQAKAPTPAIKKLTTPIVTNFGALDKKGKPGTISDWRSLEANGGKPPATGQLTQAQLNATASGGYAQRPNEVGGTPPPNGYTGLASQIGNGQNVVNTGANKPASDKPNTVGGTPPKPTNPNINNTGALNEQRRGEQAAKVPTFSEQVGMAQRNLPDRLKGYADVIVNALGKGAEAGGSAGVFSPPGTLASQKGAELNGAAGLYSRQNANQDATNLLDVLTKNLPDFLKANAPEIVTSLVGAGAGLASKVNPGSLVGAGLSNEAAFFGGGAGLVPGAVAGMIGPGAIALQQQQANQTAGAPINADTARLNALAAKYGVVPGAGAASQADNTPQGIGPDANGNMPNPYNPAQAALADAARNTGQALFSAFSDVNTRPNVMSQRLLEELPFRSAGFDTAEEFATAIGYMWDAASNMWVRLDIGGPKGSSGSGTGRTQQAYQYGYGGGYSHYGRGGYGGYGGGSGGFGNNASSNPAGLIRWNIRA